MDPQTLEQTAWYELKGSQIETKLDDVQVRFVLVQRGPVRAGVVFLNGKPAVLMPVGEA